jgi:hypothetical protein
MLSRVLALARTASMFLFSTTYVGTDPLFLEIRKVLVFWECAILSRAQVSGEKGGPSLLSC